jgi:hypothetical protein
MGDVVVPLDWNAIVDEVEEESILVNAIVEVDEVGEVENVDVLV